jgi:hypothetical protein
MYQKYVKLKIKFHCNNFTKIIQNIFVYHVVGNYNVSSFINRDPSAVLSEDYSRFQHCFPLFRAVFWVVLPCKMIVPDDGGSTHLLNIGRQSFYTAV